MRQLSGLDASFIYMETPNAPMHISGLGIYDQSTVPGGKLRFKEIIENIHSRILALPTMTQRLLTVPFELGHPYWVTDGTFDPEFHIRHIALPKPGDWRQLCILISRLQAKPLDRSRPLWELYVIEGLNNVEGVPKGGFALFSKTHHAAIDGVSSVDISVAVHDLTPDYHQRQDPPVVNVDSPPSAAELIWKSALHRAGTPLRLANVARKTLPGIARAYRGVSKGELHKVDDIPRTRFNGSVSPHRVFDALSIPLADIKKIKNSVAGATVNDVATAIIGGALRKYLQDKNELPEESLAALAPVNIRAEEDNTRGNQVSGMRVQVHSDIEPPLERLQAVQQSTANAKEYNRALDVRAMNDYTQFLPSLLTAETFQLATRLGVMSRVSLGYNCVITNVPGPQVPIYSTGARLVASYGSGPIMNGLGLFHSLGSYCGQFMISATSCRQMMPDPAFYRQCIQDSFEELLSVADGADN